MHVPKIVFTKLSLEDNINMIKDFWFNSKSDEDTFNPKEYLKSMYPEFINIESNSQIKQEKIIEDVVTKVYKEKESIVEKKVEHFQNVWDKVNNEYMESISSYLNIEWNTDIKEIKAEVAFIPICPRYLDTHSFYIAASANDDYVKEICAHECCHFLWFEKIKQIYPEIPKEEYDSPYTCWKYSEMVVDPILNNKTINKYIGIEEKAYPEFYELIDNENNRLVMDNLKDIYSENTAIEEKIDKGFNYIKTIYNTKNKRK